MTNQRTPALLPAAGLLLALGLLAGCSGGSSGGGSGATGAGDASVASGEAADSAGAARAAAPARRAGAPDKPLGRSVISTGSVELTSDDVPDARLDVLRVVARYGGQVADEQTATDPDAPVAASAEVGDEGSVPGAAEGSTQGDTALAALTHTHLVVRVPSARFDAAMRDLAGVGRFVASSRQTSDVTTRVIDVRARVRVQARSVARITELLDRATDIREIVAVESQLSRRQADLDSLRRQSAYLADQTSLSTITVDLDRRTAAERRSDHNAFVGGIVSGWQAFTGMIGGLLTALGALLPFLIVGLPLGLALWLLRSRRRRSTTPVIGDEAAPGPAS